MSLPSAGAGPPHELANNVLVGAPASDRRVGDVRAKPEDLLSELSDWGYLRGMLKRFAAVVLLAFIGLAAGVAYSVLSPSFAVGDTFVLPAHSPRSAMDLVVIARNGRPSVLVTSHGRQISFSSTGSLGHADRAVEMANRAVLAANNGRIKAVLRYLPARLYKTSSDALIGLLAGLGTALGFLVPFRWRMGRTA